jgi:hypothetical protein
MMYICCVVEDYSVIFSVLLLKSPFYYCYYAKFFCDLTRIFLDYFFWQILLVSFAELCLQAVHNVESARG